MSQCQILFIVKQKQNTAWNASKKPGLWNAVATLSASLNALGINSDVVDVPDANSIHGVVTQRQPQTVIIEAFWVPPGKISLLKSLHPKKEWIIRNHSEVPFLAEEGIAGSWTAEYIKMGTEVTSVSRRTVSDLSPLITNLKANPKLLSYLPNIYPPQTGERPKIKLLPKNEIHIACFGAVRSMKNHLMQTMASIQYASLTKRKLFFHINGTRIEASGSNPLKNLINTFRRMYNADLVEHPWMEKDVFYELMQSKIDLVLQCSLTESFNIVAADAVLCSVPVIASPEVRWLNKESHCNPTSVISISNKIQEVFGQSQESFENYIQGQYAQLALYNEKASEVWTKRFLM